MKTFASNVERNEIPQNVDPWIPVYFPIPTCFPSLMRQAEQV